jgi:hypothetical protein
MTAKVEAAYAQGFQKWEKKIDKLNENMCVTSKQRMQSLHRHKALERSAVILLVGEIWTEVESA